MEIACEQPFIPRFHQKLFINKIDELLSQAVSTAQADTESRKNITKHTKKAAKYPRLYTGFSDLTLNRKTKPDNKIILKAIDFFE